MRLRAGLASRFLATMAASAPLPFQKSAITESIPLVALRVNAKQCGHFLNDRKLKRCVRARRAARRACTPRDTAVRLTPPLPAPSRSRL
jgi:hypothetical protein